MRRALANLACAGVLWLALVAVSRGEPLLVSLPAALDSAAAERMAGDVLELLNRRTGLRFQLAHHHNVLAYLDDLESGRFALVVEGPHVLAALSERGRLHPIAEFRHDLSYVVVVPSDAQQVYEPRDLSGKPVCTGPLPDLFALHLAATIGSPTREPVSVPVSDPLRRIRQLISGQCHAATLQTSRFMALSENEGSDEIRIIYKSETLPGIGAAVSDHLDPELRNDIADALLSVEGVRATRAMSIGFFGTEAPLGASDPARLQPLAGLMQHDFGP